MFSSQKCTARRAAIREGRPDTSVALWNQMKACGAVTSVGIAMVFCILAIAILMLREDVVPYRPGQAVPNDVISRVDFSFQDKGLLDKMRQEAQRKSPRIYRSKVDAWQTLQNQLMSLPDQVAGLTYDQLPAKLKEELESGTLTALQQYQVKAHRDRYNTAVTNYIQALHDADWIILPATDRQQDLQSHLSITLQPGNSAIDPNSTYPIPANDELKTKIKRLVTDNFLFELQPLVLAMTQDNLQPTYELDADATAEARNNAADHVPTKDWQLHFNQNQPMVYKGVLDAHDWELLRKENQEFIKVQGGGGWKSKLGVAGMTLLLTIALSVYTIHFQWRIVRNHARAIAIAALMLSMLLLAQLAGMSSGPIYLLAVAPTLLVAIILAIAYEQRYAVGVASIHGLLVTIGLDQRVGFLLVVWIGIISAVFMLNDIRSRSKLIEVGAVTGAAMMATTAAWGAISLDPWAYIMVNCGYVFLAGFAVGFVILGILPFIEKAFRITTNMTLLELADASHPLLRRLAIEAPGTYSHSMQVATLSEAAAEAIGANSLLCRVAAYYHDVGKINKVDYFMENQPPGEENRHIHLNPSVSFLIIKGHVMDGVELAREYNLPTSLFPFILQHHGTTLVEYFYHAACNQQEKREDEPAISDTQFRYPGPKPKTKEVGILMLADCVESAGRAMAGPTPVRIETLVHELILRRLLDGQFDDCDMTMRDLDRVEKSLVKTLLSIYHGRLSYPSTASLTASDTVAVRTA
jgi:putative nucleotidyltransferase with HDIG domain